MGCNGVDNGKLWFDNVRIPKDNILNKFADMNDAGELVCGIKDKRA